MKKYLRLTILFLLAFLVRPVLSQKVSIDLNRTKGSSLTYWRIVDGNGTEVASENDHMNEDSVTFSLESEKLYSLWIIVQETNIPVLINYNLAIDGEPTLYISGQTSSGDHEYKFFTGVHKPRSKIIGGDIASIADFPWQVYFISGNYLCGGSIIAPGWILTAAHCTEDHNNIPIAAADMSIIVGSETPKLANHGQKYYVSEVIRNLGYNNQTLENDIALLRLSQPIDYPNATPIRLVSTFDVNDGATAPGVMAWVTGWGLIQAVPQILASELRKVQLPIVSLLQASTVWSSIPSTDLMAGYNKGNQDACNGDSGGPLVVPVTGEFKLAGIVSWGNSTCNTYGGYTSVSNFLSWIAENTGIADFRPSVPVGDAVICNPADTTTYNIEEYPSASGYEWKLYPDEIGTVISNTTIAKVSWDQSYTGMVYVMARTTVNNVVSDWSKLKVMVAPQRKIVSSSGDITICTNIPVTISVNAQGYNLTYNWYKNNSLFKSGSSNSVSFFKTSYANNGIYRCDVTNVCGVTSSPGINLTVLPLTAITSLSHNIEVPFGDSPTMNVTSGGYNLTYQWEKDGTVIADATEASLTLYDVNAKDIGLYRVTVKGTCGTQTSDSIYVYAKSNETIGNVDAAVWPTLVSDEFNIAVNIDESYTVLMYSSAGLLVKELKNCRYQTSIYAGTLASGNYIQKIFNNNFRRTFRVIKK